MRQSYCLSFLLGFMLLAGCNPGTKQGDLPYLGNKHAEDVVEIDPVTLDTLTRKDTVYHQIASFSFLNQEGKAITNDEVEGKVYVADFFFTSCPTICPSVKKQMLRAYDEFHEEPDFKVLSHSIDAGLEPVALLEDYAERMGVEDASTWHLPTGDRKKIFDIVQTSYLT